MTEYVALSLALGIIMFFLLELSQIDMKYEGDTNNIMRYFRLACILIAFLMGIALLGLSTGIASDNSAGATIIAAINGSLTAYTVLTVIGVCFLLVYALVLIPRWYKDAADMKKISGEED